LSSKKIYKSHSYDDVVDACRYLLNNSPFAEPYREYVNSRLNPQMQEEFKFGYFPGIDNINLLTSFVSEEKLKEAQLLSHWILEETVSYKKVFNSFFENHPLILPYRDVYGNIIALVGRTLLSDQEREAAKIPKYKNTFFKKGNHVFGLYEAKQSIIEKDLAYVVEGQFDVIKAREKGHFNFVAVGNNNITDYQLSLICRYSKNIFILFDNDEGGEVGSSRAMSKFGNIANVHNLHLPIGYKDIYEYLSQNDNDSIPFSVRNTNIH